ncbi:MAG: hypothetical protein IJM42_00570 [Synergistes sp.]|nr:hypothetical protein [Synergistes sp.]
MRYYSLGGTASNTVLLQPVTEGEASSLMLEFTEISKLYGRDDFCLTVVVIDDWDLDLSPWEAPPVFGRTPFGGGAEKSLKYITETVIPEISAERKAPPVFYIGGYSLAGLFALWAVYKTDLFKGAAAVSPSVWFPDFTNYAKENTLRTDRLYLSLGDKEEKARNPVMARVGDAIRELDSYYTQLGIPHDLEWNEGNHFKDPELRTAKGFAWLLRGGARKEASARETPEE